MMRRPRRQRPLVPAAVAPPDPFDELDSVADRAGRGLDDLVVELDRLEAGLARLRRRLHAAADRG